LKIEKKPIEEEIDNVAKKKLGDEVNDEVKQNMILDVML
jgi:hypothetical protein